MEYVNANFFSVADLDDIDNHINRLRDEKAQLEKSGPQNVSFPDVDTSTATEAVSAIQSLNPGKVTVEDVDLLVEKYGDLRLLRKVRDLLISRGNLAKQSETLETGSQIEQKLQKLDKIDLDELENVLKSIGSLADQEIQQSLRSQLGEILEKEHQRLAAELRNQLKLIKWLSPKENLSIDAARFKQITGNIRNLVRLQAIVGFPEYPASWWALDVLTEPFKIRFDYHFNQNTETNKMSRPEWALNFLEKFLAENLASFESVLGNVFLQYKKIGVFEVITALLGPARQKLLSMSELFNQTILDLKNTDDTATLEKYGRVLSHLIFEATSFDQRLRNTYKYNPFIEDFDVPPQKKWLGLTGDILLGSSGESALATNWLDLEFRLAKSTFDRDILNADNVFEIDYEFDASSANAHEILKPTYSAYALVKLFDNLTTHFKTVRIVKYQLKYVSNIQLVFLDEYLKAVNGEFQKCSQSLSSKLIANFLPGATKQETNASTSGVIQDGLKMLNQLTGLYCSLKFVTQCMEQWSEELVFTQLWAFYRSISPNVTEESIFDNAKTEYTELQNRIADKYEEFFKKQTRSALKQYVNSCTWNLDDSAVKSEPSPLLSTFVTVITSYTLYLRRALPEVDYFLVTIKICDSFASIFQEYVVTNNQFNKNGVAQLTTDFDYLVRNLDEPLLLNTGLFYSNGVNKNFRKVLQSIDVLATVDAATAEEERRTFEDGEKIRALFPSRLDALTDRECNDLLYRIL